MLFPSKFPSKGPNFLLEGNFLPNGNAAYIMRAQYKINFDRPPRFKKLPEALIISPELRHLYKQTDTNSRNLDRLYITRPKRLDTSKRRHAILHVKNSVLPSAAITYIQLTICVIDKILISTSLDKYFITA